MPDAPSPTSEFSVFKRDFMDPDAPLKFIGAGSLGGKAQSLAFMQGILKSEWTGPRISGIAAGIPPLVVIRSGVFDAFMASNQLYEIALSNLPDDRIAHAFQKADLPFEVLGDLRALIESAHTPLAVRSSSLLEDALKEPFAGIYGTKMIPNNVFDPDVRFRGLVEAVKFVFASTFFEEARDYHLATGHNIRDEKMAVIIQQVVGKRYHNRFYPELSGVARSYNYYPVGRAKPEDGVVNLALGLGKTIVDGGITWTYSPALPDADPPFRSAEETLDLTQTTFWAVNMGEPAGYDPIKETEYLLQENLMEADADGTLPYLASTYSVQDDRLTMGTGTNGPRALTFAPLLKLDTIPFNPAVIRLLQICEKALGAEVEIEFAMTFNPHRLNLLQVRPMAAPTESLEIPDSELTGENVLGACRTALGHGRVDTLRDIIYVKPEVFDLSHSEAVVPELERLNHKMLTQGKLYVLIVLGRLGTNIPWLGIPANWGQVSGARVIVEAARESINVELSQGSHYFHNIINLGVKYFCMPHSNVYKIDWAWLNLQKLVEETPYLRHVELVRPVIVKVDGKSRKGVILKE